MGLIFSRLFKGRRYKIACWIRDIFMVLLIVWLMLTVREYYIQGYGHAMEYCRSNCFCQNFSEKFYQNATKEGFYLNITKINMTCRNLNSSYPDFQVCHS